MKTIVYFVVVTLIAVGQSIPLREDDSSIENKIINEDFLYDERTAKFPVYLSYGNSQLWLPTFNGIFFPRTSFSEKQIQFYLLTKSNPNKNVTWNGKEPAPAIDVTKPTKVFVHGWLNDITCTWYDELAKAYFKEADYNIILVDWSKESKYMNYFKSAGSTLEVGNYIGHQILNMGLDFDKVHVIGHSLGGQVAGFVGKYLFGKVHKKIERVTALDPARPYFENNEDIDRITEKDAKVVDVIHTDAGAYGCKKPMGTIDFYPNGGRDQPGCDFFEHFESGSCSHARSYYLFIQSVNTKDLVARRCDSEDNYENGLCNNNEKNVLGEYADLSRTGIFYLDTTGTSPYVNKR